GAFLETTAILQLLWTLDSIRIPKTITITIDYLRTAGPHDTFARAQVTKLGNRVANVRAHAWQTDTAKPGSSANGNFLITPAREGPNGGAADRAGLAARAGAQGRLLQPGRGRPLARALGRGARRPARRRRVGVVDQAAGAFHDPEGGARAAAAHRGRIPARAASSPLGRALPLPLVARGPGAEIRPGPRR